MDKPLTPPSLKSLRTSLSPAASTLFDAARSAGEQRGLELWAVGGTVRDVVTERALVDVDLAVDREAGAVAEAVAAATGGSATIEARFGTASVTLDDERLDLATLRAERYEAPGALPAVTLGAPIESDLERRDFSVNAIALGVAGPRAGEVLDPFGGIADLASQRFRVLHERSFEDDATRLWRAARLSAQHDLRPTASTRALILEGVRWLETISGDRLWSEFELIAERGRAVRTLGLLDEWGVLEATSPGLALTDAARRALRHRWRRLPAARLAAVLLAERKPAVADAALRRLNAPSDATRAVADARTLLAAASTEPDDLETLARTGTEGRLAALWLDPAQAEVQRRVRRWERTRQHLEASELLRMGVPEGPEVGRLLHCLRRGRYLGTLGSVADARALVRRHLEAAGGTR